jgi:hypothetical protein
VVAVKDRQVDGLVDALGEPLQVRADLLPQLAERRRRQPGQPWPETHAARGRHRHQEALGGQRLDDPVHGRARKPDPLGDLGEAQASRRGLERREDP